MHVPLLQSIAAFWQKASWQMILRLCSRLYSVTQVTLPDKLQQTALDSGAVYICAGS